ncbi:spore germination protein [Halobacillus karajensis]|uniref:Spore germination protein A3 n=1 Tax=Halobacillus karajensis TaxID=195088 RepID=A0A024P4C2_9BACI|nr:Ger(x)C family spore germination protein [Halobacillus karajensis]CDQ20825.1 Spore germination protein A3 precursor [Halobacillus karajensis]CDQ23705.1 Spore germination protein A3 precursor [Halobacillus karajensis]CDQ27183.1 Spore germination protein A3 precursor [Halobacillus karajensis]SEI03956.1 spore germination protein [Halobacillus karajensis]
MKAKNFLVLLISMSLLSGCMQHTSVEENAIIQMAGYDKGENKRIRGTMLIPQYGSSESKSATSEVYLTANGDGVKEVEKEIQKQSSKPISIGKLSVTLYSKELAEGGISDIIDILSRDPRMSRNMYLGIVDGEAIDLIESQYPQEDTTYKQLEDLIKNNARFNFPMTNLHDFLYSYYAQGMDAFLPLITKKEANVELSGLAFFKGGTVVSTIPDSNVFTYKMLNENFKRGMQNIPYKDGTIMLDNIGSSVEYELKNGLGEPKFDIRVNIKAEVNEMVGVDREANPSLMKELEEVSVEFFETNANELIQMFKEKEIDPLGLGNFAKTRKRDFDLTKWKDNYSDLKVNVKVNVEITEYGIFS